MFQLTLHQVSPLTKRKVFLCPMVLPNETTVGRGQESLRDGSQAACVQGD